jgi:hypothetical protein
MAMNKNVRPEDIAAVARLRECGHPHKNIAELLHLSLNRVKYLVSLVPKPPKDNKELTRKWYRKERKTFTDSMPNPFPKWWCELHNLDHNFYRKEWKE